MYGAHAEHELPFRCFLAWKARISSTHSASAMPDKFTDEAVDIPT